MILPPCLTRAALLCCVLAVSSGALAQSANPPAEAKTEGVIFPPASRLGLAPPAGMRPATTFPGFEDSEGAAFIRLVGLPPKAYAEIEKTMTDQALKAQGLTVEKREAVKIATGRALLVLARQETKETAIRKYLLIAELPEMTALISFEVRRDRAKAYPDADVRRALLSVATRKDVPAAEQLALMPFRLTDTAGFRIAGLVPGRAIQLSDEPNDVTETIGHATISVGILPGQTPAASDRDAFARNALTGLPNMKDLRFTGSEPLRFSGQQGYEIRALARDVKSGGEIEIVQWLRFGGNAYLRVLGYAPKDAWQAAYPRFRAVRDGLEPR